MARNLVSHKRSRIFLVLFVINLLGATVAPLVLHAAPVTVADPETVYIVQRGDTLSALARRYGVTVQALIEYNSLTSTKIYVGQRLLIPGQSTPIYPITYVVQRGDTLAKIAQRYDTTVAAVRAANGLTNNTIYVGQRLLIPNSLGYPTPTPIPAPGRERIQVATGAASVTVRGTGRERCR